MAKDKEDLGITRPTDDFLPHGTLVTIQRSRLLEVKYVFLLRFVLFLKGCKESVFYSLLLCTSPKFILPSPKILLTNRINDQMIIIYLLHHYLIITCFINSL